ncbi:MAG: 4Fe-4S binding protein [Clostridiales bacterium]|jgi:ferredoxin|nr:4Fe-4S binding protein [Clostridiales bacterium]
MAYFITSKCISCGQCEPECAQACISPGDDAYVIDPANCIDCGACADICPVEAPEMK